MKHAYPYAVLALALLLTLPAVRAQQLWRPFQPGLIYTYCASAATTPPLHTLRVDSSYVTPAGDSVYAFNRLMRHPASGGTVPAVHYYRSRNNLFGARLRWRSGTAEFFLEANAEANSGGSATELRLLPRVPVGSTWAASSQLALTATLTSRGFGNGTGLPDTVATITLSNGQLIQLGRLTGLVRGPQWLQLADSGAAPTDSWTVAYPPQTLAQSPYYPLALFSLGAGDELGYLEDPFTILPASCFTGVLLRRILSRRQTPDSLVLTYQEQERRQNFGAPGCGSSAGTVTYPVGRGRWAFSLRTGKSPQFSALPLLTGEYAPGSPTNSFAGLVMGNAISSLPGSGAFACHAPLQIGYQRVYLNQPGVPSGGYSPGLDYLAWQQWFGVASQATPTQTGLGELGNPNQILSYVRRAGAGGAAPYTCGNPLVFADLLPTRAAQAAAVATLYPNPAADAATLLLAAPARPESVLRLTDALSRTLWTAAVPTGQTTVRVPLAGQPAGLYLVHLSSPTTTTTWKLTHE